MTNAATFRLAPFADAVAVTASLLFGVTDLARAGVRPAAHPALHCTPSC